MRISLQGYFDLGTSFGFDDRVFGARPAPDLAWAGLANPFGRGINVDLTAEAPRLLSAWRDAAVAFADNPDAEFGTWPTVGAINREALKTSLRASLAAHPIASCTLTIYSVGIAFLRLVHAPGVPLEQAIGFHRCYEFAAYSSAISDVLLGIATTTVRNTLAESAPRLESLSRRPRAAEGADLFTSFTCVALAIDEGDDIASIRSCFSALENAPLQDLQFEYHGRVQFGWSACVVEPRPASEATAEPWVEIGRILACIELAHLFLGVCEALENLLRHETVRQVEGYVMDKAGGRTPDELNRLRVLSMGLITMSQYESVGASDEEQRYFELWEHHARLKVRHQRVVAQADLLHNVQAAETTRAEGDRERLLNRVVLFLTAFTFVSVLVDSYNFIAYYDGWFGATGHRAGLLTLVFLGVAATLIALFRAASRSSLR